MLISIMVVLTGISMVVCAIAGYLLGVCMRAAIVAFVKDRAPAIPRARARKRRRS